MQQVLPDFFRAQLIRRSMEEAGEVGYDSGVAGDRAVGKVPQLQIADHPFAQFGHQRPPSIVEYPQTTLNATRPVLPQSGLVQVGQNPGICQLSHEVRLLPGKPFPENERCQSGSRPNGRNGDW
jgi:hypothetical protein